jgi:hypothetical protein
MKQNNFFGFSSEIFFIGNLQLFLNKNFRILFLITTLIFIAKKHKYEISFLLII